MPEDIGADLFKHQRRARLHRLLGIDHHRQRLVVDLDQIQRVLGGRAIDRGHGRDRFADIARLFGGQGVDRG
jgi:hypothetical protein